MGWRGWRALVFGLTLAGFTSFAFERTNDPLCEIRVLQAGGKTVYRQALTNSDILERVRLPSVSRHQRLVFSFGPKDGVANEPLRLRRKLEGHDQDWEEAGGDMQVSLAVYAASDQVLSYDVFTMAGESEGWTGDVLTSRFETRRESFILPAGARRLQVLFLSKDWKGLGVSAVKDFRLLRSKAGGGEENVWPDSGLNEGENLDQPEGKPRYWWRSSLGANQARVVLLSGSPKKHALMIFDDDLHLPATWQADFPLADPAGPGPGARLTLEWKQAYSVGIGGRQRAGYDSLAPGRYVFRVKTVTPSGEPVGREVTLPVSIAQVFWKRVPFVIFVVGLFAAIVSAVARAVVRRRLQIRLDRLEHRRRIEHERLRIAQDIHDDLGASLTQINLLSQTAHKKVEESHPAWKDTERLRALAVSLTQKLDETVWAVSPRHDTFESLLSYLTDLASEFLGSAGIRARIDVPAELPAWKLPAGLRHNVFLATKEALNNVIKHSRATEMHLRLVLLKEAFELMIEDNGCGYSLPASPLVAGARPVQHGLDGIRQRIESLGGKFRIDSEPGLGTRVAFTVPVKQGKP